MAKYAVKLARLPRDPVDPNVLKTLGWVTKPPALPSPPSKSDSLEGSGPRKIPVISAGGPSEVYGVRDGRLFALAVKLHGQGEIYVHGHAQFPWYVYLATDINESLFERGQFRRIRASTVNDVKNIFELEGLEINFSKPQNIVIPDRSIFDDDPGVARPPGKLMRTAAPQTRTDRLPTSQTKLPSGVHMNKKQKAVLIAAAAAVVGMLILPPFQIQIPGDIARSLGYALIFDPPYFRHVKLTGTVDTGLLITQWLGVLIAGAIAFILFKD